METLENTKIPTLFGIYKLVNLKNNKIYIGSAVNLHKRIKRHFRELKNNEHYNNHLQKSYNKYGLENFTYEIIESFEEIKYEKLLEIERNYIIKYNCVEKGYNQVIDNSNHLSILNKGKNIIKNKERCSIAVFAFDRYTGEFKYEFKSVTDASLFFNTSSSNISKVCKGTLNHMKNFTFCYKKDYDKNKNYSKPLNATKNIKFTDDHKLKIKKALQKHKGLKIYKYDLNMNFIESYDSRNDAEKQNNIKTGKLTYKTDKETPFGGYYWKYNKI